MKKSKIISFLILLSLLLSLADSYPSLAKDNTSAAEEYYLNVTQANLLLDDSMTLLVEGVSDEEISFKSEDSTIVSITAAENNSCTLTGQAAGKTTITVKVKKKSSFFFTNTTTLQCKITVTPKAASVKFKKKQYTLTVGTKKKTAVILRPSITTELPVFSSSNPNIATINANGKVTAKAKGITTISATIKNGMTARCKVLVYKNKTAASK